MKFIVANVCFPNAVQIGGLYFSGAYNAQIINEKSVVSIYLDADPSIFLENAKSRCLTMIDVQKPIDSNDFYLAAVYSEEKNVFFVQTDIAAYFGCYLYFQDGVFAISDDIHALFSALESHVKPTISETRVRESLYYAKLPLGETVFPDIQMLLPASIYSVDFAKNNVAVETYDTLCLTSEVHDVDVASDGLYDAIDDYFAQKKRDGTVYGLGLSGGLDSRVAGYFAIRHGYQVAPYFLGVDRNAFGIYTNDYKRSVEVSKALGIEKARVFDPRKYPLAKKIENEFLHMPLPLFNSNVAQNCGYEEFGFYDVLLHGMYGGELFGQILPNNINEMNEQSLAKRIQHYYRSHPKYSINPPELLYTMLNRTKLLPYFTCKDPLFRDLLSERQDADYYERTLKWVRQQKRMGLSNANIFIKDFISRANVVRHAYYATLDDEKPSLGVYLNPAVIKYILRWDESLLFDRKVQFALLRRLGKMADIRGQAYWVFAGKSKLGKFAIVKAKIMYYVRGRGMVYSKWFSQKEIKRCEHEYAQGSVLFNSIKLDPVFHNQMYNRVYDLILLSMLEKKYQLPISE